MQIFKTCSRILGLVKRWPLKHVLLKSNSCAAASPSNEKFFSKAMQFSTKMEGSDGDFSMSSSDNSASNLTVDGVHVINVFLNEIINVKTIGGRTLLGDDKIKSLCAMYNSLSMEHRKDFLVNLATNYATEREKVLSTAQNLEEIKEDNLSKQAKCEEALRNALTPLYSWLFKRIGRLDNGVKFLVDFRADILSSLSLTDPTSPLWVALQQLNTTLRDLLSIWFSVGFLRLERLTWQSPCEMLQKISEYEAVHPVRNWTDIKSRVGPYRRCFVFVHNSMAGEPLVVLHTALCDEIPTSLAGIVNSRTRMPSITPSITNSETEDSNSVKAAIFYSITSTQRGLQGIDLGNYLIKRVVRELQAEFPHMLQFSTLSPIPAFKPWLLEKIKMAERGYNELLTSQEMESLQSLLGGEGIWTELRHILKNNSWVDNIKLSDALQLPLLRLCARYLYLEKRRGSALCSVGNFHLSNGAVLWRINWRADLSVRGLKNSCGIMVNYRYFLEDTEHNSEQYLSNHVIAVSPQVVDLSASASSLTLNSKL